MSAQLHDPAYPDPGDGPSVAAPPGPILQSATIGFRVVYVVVLLLGVLWFGSNDRIISSGNQAVVMQFGRVVRTHGAGLLLAWPRPIEEVLLLPGPDRQLTRQVAALPPVQGISYASTDATQQALPATATPYLTGDGKVVLLDANLVYRITDARAYILAQEHVAPALDRIFRAAAVQVAAGQDLNDFLVVQNPSGDNAAVTGAAADEEEDENATAPATPSPAAAAAAAAASTQSIDAVRAAVRERLLDGMNARLKDLANKGDSLGVEIDRIDWTALLPPEAKLAFDSVLTAAQKADQNIAAANTAAELRRQGAQREADRLTAAAQAVALERTVQATVDTTSIDAIERTSGSHAGLAEQQYRNQIGQVLGKAGNVIAIDPNGGQRVLMTGPPRPGPR